MSTTHSLMARLFRAGLFAFLGRPEEGKALAADLEEGRLPGYIPAGGPALLYAMQGEKEKALAHLEQDFQEGDRILWNYYQSEFLDPIRDEPRFVALLRAMKLPTGIPRRVTTNLGRLPP